MSRTRGAAVAGDLFDIESRGSSGGDYRAIRAQRVDELLNLDCSPDRRAPPLSPGTHSSGGPSTSRRRRRGEWAHMSGAPKRSQPAVHSRRNARPWRAPRTKATLRWRFFVKLARHAAHRAPASAAWFACALRLVSEDAPAEERVELLLAQARYHRRPASSPRAARSPRASRSSPTIWSPCRRG